MVEDSYSRKGSLHHIKCLHGRYVGILVFSLGYLGLYDRVVLRSCLVLCYSLIVLNDKYLALSKLA